MTSRHEWLGTVAATAAVLALCAVTAVVTAAGSAADYPWLDAGARALMVGVPLAVGLYARRRPASRRFGDLLVIVRRLVPRQPRDIGQRGRYSIGRVAGWVVEVGLVYLVLAFPSGTLGRVDRALVGSIALVVALLYLPTALLVEQDPTPSPRTSCTADCPDNAFMLVDNEPAFVEDVIRPFRELLVVYIFAAATLRLAWRIEHASHVLRRSLTPVLAVAIFRLGAFRTGIGVRQLVPGSPLAEVLAWLIALSLPALASAFLVGLVRCGCSSPRRCSGSRRDCAATPVRRTSATRSRRHSTIRRSRSSTGSRSPRDTGRTPAGTRSSSGRWPPAARSRTPVTATGSSRPSSTILRSGSTRGSSTAPPPTRRSRSTTIASPSRRPPCCAR